MTTTPNQCLDAKSQSEQKNYDSFDSKNNANTTNTSFNDGKIREFYRYDSLKYYESNKERIEIFCKSLESYQEEYLKNQSKN
ncbi:hypothetical protein WICMUC_004629 [Wickerhamomyces mucosus]|uniref:Uncharacterized protein n=1 Tax=Wickerhamomyces mucosus TaxID=1378264 RepID=A0A9P8T9K5_9ASCO|nr:hypothetical protein WICMUC_004629 [Wickerhamomyces mucosus]